MPEPTQSDHPPTPNIPAASAILRIQSSILIDAPIEDVWTALTDTSTWPSWNKFVPRVTIREQPDRDTDSDNDNGNEQSVLRLGSRMTFHVNMNASESESESSRPRPEDAGQVVQLVVIECQGPGFGSEQESGSTRTWTSGAEGKEGGGGGGKCARITWANDVSAQSWVMGRFLFAERVHELREVEVEVDVAGQDGGSGSGSVKRMTEVRNWESQVGYLAYVVRWMFEGRLRENFEVWVRGLKGFVEEGKE